MMRRSVYLIGSLERVYGALTFYLPNKEAVEGYLQEQDNVWKEMEEKQSPLPGSIAPE